MSRVNEIINLVTTTETQLEEYFYYPKDNKEEREKILEEFKKNRDKVRDLVLTEEEITELFNKIINNELEIKTCRGLSFGYGNIEGLIQKLCKYDKKYFEFLNERFLNEEMIDIALAGEEDYKSVVKSFPVLTGNTLALKKIVEKDGRLLEYASSSALTEEIVEIALANGFDPETQLKNAYGLNNNAMAMKKICEKNGKALEFIREKALTEEIVEIALANGFNPETQLEKSYPLRESPMAMQIFCTLNGKNLKQVRPESLTKELIELSLSNPDPTKRFDPSTDMEFCFTLKEDPMAMKMLIEIDGKNLQYAHKDVITEELIELGIANGYNIDEQIRFSYGLKDNLLAMTYLIKKNGRYLKYANNKIITEELIDLAIANGFRIEEDLEDATGLIQDEVWMKKLCKMDGKCLKHAYSSAITPKLIEIAMNNEDPTKRFDIRKDFEGLLEKYVNSIFDNSETITQIIDLFSGIDGYVLQYAKEEGLTEEILEKAVAHGYNIEEQLPLTEGLHSSVLAMDYFCKKNIKSIRYAKDEALSLEKVEEAMQYEEVKEDDDVQKDIFQHTMSMPEKYKLPVYQQIIENICKKHNINREFFEELIEKAFEINEDFTQTLNPEFLEERYQRLYNENNYEKLFVLGTYPDVQQQIIKIANPKDENNNINIELGNKRIELLDKLLEQSITKEDGMVEKDWVPYYAKIITAFSSNPSQYDNLLGVELTQSDINTLTLHTIGKHNFEIKNIEELRNYEETKNKYIENILSTSEDIETVRDAVFEKQFGISINIANELYIPYMSLINESKELFDLSVESNKNIVDFFKAMEIIMKETNIEELKKSVKESTLKLSSSEIIKMRTALKKIIVNDYNKSIFSTKDKTPDATLEEIPIYKAGGEKGDQEFSLSISALGAYSGFDPTIPGYNYKEDWNRPKVSSHGICTSFIGNNNLGTARIKYSVLGFTDYEESSLLLGAPEDIVSRDANVLFDTSEGEIGKDVRVASKYLSSKGIKDNTRHTHNEIVFERRIEGNKKRQPTYVVFFCDDYEKALEEYNKIKESNNEELISLVHSDSNDLKTVPRATQDGVHLMDAIKTAKDFGIPMVVVEREKIAKHEREKIDSNVELFNSLTEEMITEELVEELIYSILVQYENNHAGNRSHHEEIDEKYFNEEDFIKIVETMLSKTKQLETIDKKETIVKKLEEYANKEIEKYESKLLMVRASDEKIKFTAILEKTELVKADLEKEKALKEQQAETIIEAMARGENPLGEEEMTNTQGMRMGYAKLSVLATITTIISIGIIILGIILIK